VFPLIVLVLGLGAILTAYEFSPRVRSRIDDYARALRTAHEAHRTADGHLARAHQATVIVMQHGARRPGLDGALREAPRLAQDSPPKPSQVPFVSPAPMGVDESAGAVQAAGSRAVKHAIEHAIAATVANQQAAQSTADAAEIAQTRTERGAVVESAVRVLERGKRIEEALANLGVGQCGVRSYPRVTAQIRDAILAKLHAEGMTVTGEDPWDIDTQVAGVKLRAVWDPETQVLSLIVTASSFLAPCAVIWGRIEGALQGIIGS